MADQFTLTAEARREAFKEIDAKSDKAMAFALSVYFLFGIFLSFFYDTLFIALAVGGACLLTYFIIWYLLADLRTHQYLASAILGIFSAQFIYQLHGLFEMHFFFFVGSALLITYRNWRLVIPLMLVTVVHHATFAWLQYSGMKEIYFTQLDYMDLQAFIFHASLAAVIMGICGYWAYDLERTLLRDVAKSAILSRQLQNIQNNIAFAKQISQGNLDFTYALADETDELGKSLVSMRENLKQSTSREQEEKFVSVGLARISEIIRQYSSDVNTLADKFISTLVKYSGLNQGGLFLTENDGQEAYLNLSACYAYDRKKHLEKRINPGEGMIGQCFLERDEIYLTEVPKNYIRITSGLGDAPPRCILVVPVKTEDEVVGVIEIASFHPLKISERQFIREAAKNIASALVSTRTTERIKRLLEESQQRTEQLRAQEEEIRQNMEELTATQEEITRKANETANRISAVEESGIASIEFDTNGRILDANKHFLALMEYTLAEIQGKHHRIFVDSVYGQSEEYQQFWKDLSNGIPRPGEYTRFTKTGKAVYIKGSYSIIRDSNGRPAKILKLASDLTALRKHEQHLEETLVSLKQSQREIEASKVELENTIEAINESMAVIEFSPSGEILTANENFLKLMDYDLAAIKGRHHHIFVHQEFRQEESYLRFWKDLAAGKTIKGEFNRIDRRGRSKWIKGNYSPIIRNGKVERILKIAYDISEYKNAAKAVEF